MVAKPLDERFLSIACVNFQVKWADKQANLQRIKTFSAEAAKAGSNIVVFPELALSGCECDESIDTPGQSCAMHTQLAEIVPGPSTLEMAALAKEMGIYIIFGMPEQDRDDAHIRYISSVIIGPEGILGTYRKIHLSPPPHSNEWRCFTKGNQAPVWETSYGTIGILICYDFLFFPELARIMALKGARLIINTTGSGAGPGKGYFIVQQTGSRAAENIIYTATANLVGKERTKTYAGHSVITGPLDFKPIHVFAEAGESEEIITATLDFKKLSNRYETIPWKEDHRCDLITQEFSRLLKK